MGANCCIKPIRLMKNNDKLSQLMRLWTAAYAHLKNEFMEDEKYHNLMTWLKLTMPWEKLPLELCYD